jgi:glutaredoxin
MQMEIEIPSNDKFTIYSKSGCINCGKVKDFLKTKNLIFKVVDCDDYLLENKEFFLSFIKNCAKKDCKTFPMVFYNGDFIGGFDECKLFAEKLIAFSYFKV